MNFTLIDSNNEIVSLVSAPSEEMLALNTPQGVTTVSGQPPSLGYYRQGDEWISKGEQPSDHHAWNVITKQWDDTKTLAIAQEEQWTIVKAARDAVINGGLSWRDSSNTTRVFDTDEISQGRISGAFSLAAYSLANNLPFSKTWKLADNTTVDLSAVDIISVGASLAQMVQQAINTGETLRLQINQATTIPEVESIVWHT